MPAKTHTMHGRDHCPGGADPIPCLPPSLSGHADFEAAILATGPVGYWRLGEADEPFADTSGWGPANATVPADLEIIVGTTSHVETGVTGALADDAAVRFSREGTIADPDDIADALQFTGADSDRFAFPVDAPYSVALWVNPHPSVVGGWDGALISGTQLTLGGFRVNEGWSMDMAKDTRILRWMRCSAGVGYEGCVTPGAMPDGEWQWVCGTYDGTTMKLYVGGEHVSSHTATSSLPATVQWLSIGWTLVPNDPGAERVQTANADIDEAAVWDRALTEDEILGLIAEGTEPDATATGKVLTSDGTGASAWMYPTIAVNF